MVWICISTKNLNTDDDNNNDDGTTTNSSARQASGTLNKIFYYSSGFGFFMVYLIMQPNAYFIYF